MKIGIDARSLEGDRTGVGRYLENLLKFWRNEKDCRFFLFFKKEFPQDEFLKSDNFNLILRQTKSNFLFTHKTLPRLINEYDCDIFFSPGYILPLFINIPCALTLHDIIYQARPDLYNWISKADIFNLKFVSKLSAKNAKVIFTPSQFTKNEVIKYYNIDTRRIIVTPLAADQQFLIRQSQKFNFGEFEVFPPSKNQLRSDYAALAGTRYIVFAGACFDRRHIKELIFAVDKLKKESYDIRLLIAGPDLTKKQDITKVIHSINRYFNLELVVYKLYLQTKDLAVLLSNAVGAVYLSDYEGFGLPVIEAMACGCPVITGPAEALKETAGDSALIVERAAKDEIYNKIKLILEDENLRRDLRESGLKRASEFSWEETAIKTIKEIRKIRG